MERRLAAIMLTDMVGYSRLMGLDEEGTISCQKAHRDEVFDPTISQHGGRIVKSTGDGLLVEFPSAVDSVKCAVEVQEGLAGRDTDVPEDRRIQYRIGINLGDIVIDGDDILGDGVNVAARLEGLAEPGGICISGTVHDQLAGRIDIDFRDAGEQSVKNVQRPVRIWHWRTDEPVRWAPAAGETPPVPDKSSIAVLPFDNMSGDPEQEYFADGITEDIITGLSNVRTFSVLARNSTFAYKGKSVDIRRIGRDLNVNYLIEGSVRRAGDRVRVTAQLLNTQTGDNLWAERYDGTLEDIFDLQDRITSTIVGTIEPALVRAEGLRLRLARPDNMDAYDHLLRGLSYMHKVTPEDSKKSLKSFEKAIEVDPTYGRAYAFASWCYRREVEQHGLLSLSNEDRVHAVDLARQALRFDRDDPYVLAYASATILQIEGNAEEALALTERAISLHPNSHRFWNAKALTHARLGQIEETIAAANHAISIGPNDPAIWNSYLSLAEAHIQALRFEEAIDFARRATRHNENVGPAYFIIAAAAATLDRMAEASDALDAALRINPGMTISGLLKNFQLARFQNLDAFLDGLRKAGLPTD